MLGLLVHKMYDELPRPKETRFVMSVDNNAAFIIGALRLGYELVDGNGNSELVDTGRHPKRGMQTYVRGRKY